jgi:hypothetical protein
MNGHDDSPTSKTTQRIRFHNNLVVGMDSRPARDGGRASPIGANKNGRSGVAVFAAFGVEDLIVTKNTIYDFRGNAPTFLFFDSTRAGAHAGLIVQDNIFAADKATIASISGTFPGSGALDRQWTQHPEPKWTFRNNVLCCDAKNESPGDNFWPKNMAEIGFVNAALGSLRLGSESKYKTSGSSNGPIGIDLAELEAAIGNTLESMLPLLTARQPTESPIVRSRSRK